MKAVVRKNLSSGKFELVVNDEVKSTSVSWGHWEYHLSRGTLSKKLTALGVDSVSYEGFTPEPSKPRKPRVAKANVLPATPETPAVTPSPVETPPVLTPADVTEATAAATDELVKQVAAPKPARKLVKQPKAKAGASMSSRKK